MIDQQKKDQGAYSRVGAESMRNVHGQENGTIQSGQHFGPAQRSYYPEAQWALAPIASSREVVEHPPPQSRRRRSGEPAFLRGSAATGYIAPLLTIYHSIPLAREALLSLFLEVLAYGHNPDWWTGTSDENSKLVSVRQASPGDTDRLNYLCEIQCLMAFLDNTSRAYGSVDALAGLRFFQYLRPQSSFTHFLEAWQSAAMHEKLDEPLTQVFTSTATKGPDLNGTPADSKDVFLIEGPVKHATDQIRLLDLIVWNDALDQALDNVWFEKFGHVFTMRIHNDEPASTKLNLLPTEIWYLDRYTSEFREVTFDMRYRSRAIVHEIARLSKAQQRLRETSVGGASGARVNVRQALEAGRDLLPVAAVAKSEVEEGFEQATVNTDEELAEVQNEINELIERLDLVLKHLDQQKAELRSQMTATMSDFIDPANSSRPLRHKYVLQGVSTKPNITYFRRLNPDLIDMHEDDNDEPFEVWQWWRTEWIENGNDTAHDSGLIPEDTTNGRPPYSVQKVSVAQVQDAVKSEHSTAVLVYADTTAMEFRPSPLPAALRKFVEHDNHAFENENSLNHVQQSSRARGWSQATNSTTMDDNNPFRDPAQPDDVREMTPMSTGTIRSLDGQPSPKRPRSSDDSVSDTTLMDSPPPYETVAGHERQEMVEKKGSKIGELTNQLLEKYSDKPPVQPT